MIKRVNDASTLTLQIDSSARRPELLQEPRAVQIGGSGARSA
jgi:hypothetical protein